MTSRSDTFNTAVLDAALSRGGVLDPEAWRPSVILTTPCGPLHVTPIDTWIGCRFDDPKWAKALLPHDPRLNPCSGKWNFNQGPGTLTDLVHYFETAVTRLLALPPVEKPIPPPELPKPPPGHVRAIITGGTFVVPILQTFGKVWALHHKIRADADGNVIAEGGRGRSVTHIPTGVLIKHLTPSRRAIELGTQLGEAFPEMGADLHLGSPLVYDDLVRVLDVCVKFEVPRDER